MKAVRLTRHCPPRCHAGDLAEEDRHARKFGEAVARGEVLAPAKSLEEMQRVLRNDYVDAALTVLLMALVVAVVTLGLRAALRARQAPTATTRETPYVAA